MSGAAALFLDAVLQLEARGWFRGMLDAMLAAGGWPPEGCEGRRTPAGTPRHTGSPNGVWGCVGPGGGRRCGEAPFEDGGLQERPILKSVAQSLRVQDGGAGGG